MSFRAVYKSASKFKYITQTLAKISDLTPITVDESGLTIRTLSEDKTTMISLNIPSSAFEEFECSEETFVVVPSDELNRTVRRGTRNDMLELSFKEGDRSLSVSFVDVKLNVRRAFSVPVRDVGGDRIPEPKLNLSVSMRMLAEDFKSILADAKVAGDEIEFVASKDKVEVRCVTPGREYRATLAMDRPLISLAVEKAASATYAVDLLEAALKVASAADTVTVEFGGGMPIRMTFELPTGGTLVYIVAPRIKE